MKTSHDISTNIEQSEEATELKRAVGMLRKRTVARFVEGITFAASLEGRTFREEIPRAAAGRQPRTIAERAEAILRGLTLDAWSALGAPAERRGRDRRES